MHYYVAVVFKLGLKANFITLFITVYVYQSISCSVMLKLCDPMNCSSPGSSVHGTLQARVLEWVAIPFSRGSS